MKTLIGYLDENGERILLLTFYAYIVTVVMVEVFRRFGLAYSSFWGEETARFAFIYLVWVGAAAAVKDRAHLKIDVIFNFLSPKWSSYFHLAGDVLTLIFACIALFFSVETMIVEIKFDALTHALRINAAYFGFAVSFGFALVLVRLIQSIRRDIIDIKAGRELTAGTKLFG